MNSKEKINKILNEIETDVNQQKKNVNEVIDILLNNNVTKNVTINDTSNLKYDMNEFIHWCNNNNRLYNVNYNRHLFSHGKIFGRFIIFIKRVIRKIVRFLIEPIVLDQNSFNGSVTASINAIYNNTIVFQNILNSTISELNYTKNELNILKKEINEINKKQA